MKFSILEFDNEEDREEFWRWVDEMVSNCDSSNMPPSFTPTDAEEIIYHDEMH